MTDILDRLTAAIDEADAGTDALCQEMLAEAMDSVRDLLDGSNGGYVAPQNRAERPDFDPVPIAARPTAIQLNISPEFVAACQDINHAIGAGIRNLAAAWNRTRTRS